MKNKEFERIWKQVFEKLDIGDFVIQGWLAFQKPVVSILKGLACDRSIDPNSFYVWVFVMPLYPATSIVYFSLGWRLGGASNYFEANDSRLVERLAGAVWQEALPYLERVRGPGDIPEAARICGKLGDPVVQELVALSYAKVGDTEKAVGAIDRLLEEIAELAKGGWQVERYQRMKRFKRLLLEDPAGAAAQLEQWEQETVRVLKLEKYWVRGHADVAPATGL